MAVTSRQDNDILQIDEEVAEALHERRAVVALESSAIPNGFPYPGNLESALDIDKAIRDSGAVPARVAILDGRFLVGMTQDHLERFAGDSSIPKASTRDMGVLLASGGAGATTVSASMVGAELAGIPVFSVAGIGGVHRGATYSFDISADLVQFTRSRAAVVCAGAKSVLDLRLTLEWLETAGVPVIGYRCDDFPAYFSVSSGVRNPHRIDDLRQMSRAVLEHWRTGNQGSVLVTHPIAEEDGIPSETVEEALAAAARKAEEDGVSGPAVTPYLLKAISAATEGRTAAANRSVLLSTTALAGRFAVEMAVEAAAREGSAR
ncbi:pseudouridine-5'-phosphate glycosidase [Streptomyces meridianus]|uniref:Pseudouridine-5'-phosphate glycosidase n=1 Tax=Streptomyces meridianus TaxID=2938945 RepID=A0ABT0XA47_9ACTN|nr:pseudouridine-5'-phosphate glycosidase [Streptomyces meridianus]MCM2578582.1 pseudouridine-5'-phosphate glycosidase [Streptomyces meridianus]